MGEIIVYEHISLDNVIQSPGDKSEDPSNNFNIGGWSSNTNDTTLNNFIFKRMKSDNNYLLGRKTFDIWEKYWPNHDDIWPQINSGIKYVVSTTRNQSNWIKSVFINNDIINKLLTIKQNEKKDLVVWGSSVLVNTLITYKMIDKLILIKYPIILGSGKTIFPILNDPISMKLESSIITSSGVVCSIYNYLKTK